MKLFSLIFYGLVIIAGIIFAGLNSKAVTVNYYIGSKELPLSVLLVMLFAVGVCAGILSGFVTNVKLRLENRRLRKSIENVNQHA